MVVWRDAVLDVARERLGLAQHSAKLAEMAVDGCDDAFGPVLVVLLSQLVDGAAEARVHCSLRRSHALGVLRRELKPPEYSVCTGFALGVWGEQRR